MAIYILDNDHVKGAQGLDDKSLEKMIKDIAQALCNTHWLDDSNDVYTLNPPSKIHWPVEWASPADCDCKWTLWARECVANYKYLVELGLICAEEFYFRMNDFKNIEHSKNKMNMDKFSDAIYWARDNVPDLPTYRPHAIIWDFSEEITPFPLVMPKKHIIETSDFNCDGCDYPEEDYDCECEYRFSVKPIESYRNYYLAKLKQRYKKRPCRGTPHIFEVPCVSCIWRTWWTRREPPEWLDLLFV